MVEKEFCVILTTIDNKKLAQALAKILVESGLAACVQIDKVSSFFCWNKQVKEIAEYRLMIKSVSINYDLIEKEIKDRHTYEVPEIIKLEITAGLSQYTNWIKETAER